MLDQDFSDRRQRLMDSLGEAAIILPSAPMALHHHDVEYPYRQDSDLYYFTGFPEPEAIALIAPYHPEHRFILFVRPNNQAQETWTGYRVGVEGAKAHYGADAAYPITELDQHLPQYLQGANLLYYHFGAHEGFNQQILHHYRQLIAAFPKQGRGPTGIMDSRMLTTPLRQRKSSYELSQIRQAIAISISAHRRAQGVAQPGSWEYQVQAALEADFRSQGAWGVAYPSIVAAGANACVLHYGANRDQIAAGDLLLIDAGCAYKYYNADITRTFPVTGKFSTEQRLLYEIVLRAQAAAIKMVQPGNTINDVHEAALRSIGQGLLDLGLLQGTLGEVLEKKSYKPFYMHRTSHWLGVDVHDAGFYRVGETWTALEENMVITVEPGLYIAPSIQPMEGQPPIPDRWKGIGIRIEDDVLVTATGCEVLTEELEKEIG